MRIITANVNGIRSAAKKGFFNWLNELEADVICLQEVRAHPDQLKEELYYPKGYTCEYVHAQKPGYSGVALLTRYQPLSVNRQLGLSWADEEGRFVSMEFEHCVVSSVYFPSGTSSEVRQEHKYKFLDYYFDVMKQSISSEKPHIVCGDVNIAHTKNDIKNWKTNQQTSGFLPEERAWMDKITQELGWVDAFRVVNQATDEYTWWSTRGRARENNVGWRIDYHLVTPNLKAAIQKAFIYKEERFSDHAPVVVDYDLAAL